jgi:hypothetical protein
LEEDNLLKIRRFVQGKDEEAWLSVWNVVYGQRWDLAPMTVDEMVATEKSPDFEAEGRFIAEVNTQPWESSTLTLTSLERKRRVS